MDSSRMPWAQGLTPGPCGVMLGWQCFAGAPRAGLSSAGLSIHVLGHRWLSPMVRVGAQGHGHPKNRRMGAGVEHTFPMKSAALG